MDGFGGDLHVLPDLIVTDYSESYVWFRLQAMIVVEHLLCWLGGSLVQKILDESLLGELSPL